MSDETKTLRGGISRFEALQLAATLLAPSPMNQKYAQANWAAEMAQGIHELAARIEDLEG